MSYRINGIVCEEIVAGYSESVDLMTGPSGAKGFLCDWNDRFTVAVGLLGLSATDRIGGVITMYRPARHPDMSTSYCTRVSFEPKGSPIRGARQLAYPKVIVWAEYNMMPFNFALGDNAFQQLDPAKPLVYAEQRMSSSYELMDLPGSGCKWEATGLYLQQPAVKRIALCEMEIAIKNLPYMPTNAVFEAAGSINDAKYLGVDTGKLMFNGCQTQQQFTADGEPVQEGTFKFTARTIRWDYQYDPAQRLFDRVIVAGAFDTSGLTSDLVLMQSFNGIIPEYYGQEPLTRENSLI